jgi:outer membrane lipoprotein LolB
MAILVCAAFAGCAAPGGPAPAPERVANAFAIDGRVAVRYGEESLSGRIAWTHAPDRDDLRLASPLGNQLAEIVRDPGGVTLTDSAQSRFGAPDVETLTEQRLGWRLPLGGLIDWVRARPGVGGDAQRDGAGRLTRLREAGWDIAFDYADDTARLPRRLIMGYDRSERPLEIRLVIDNWSE